jgi:hypothetical protein
MTNDSVLVRIHWNIRRRCWSRLEKRRRATGPVQSPAASRWRVVGYDAVFVLRSARFVVSASGHAQSQRRGQRTVHAWVEGTPASHGPGDVPTTEVRYDLAHGAFVDVGDPTRAVVRADWVIPDRDARVRVAGEVEWTEAPPAPSEPQTSKNRPRSR